MAGAAIHPRLRIARTTDLEMKAGLNVPRRVAEKVQCELTKVTVRNGLASYARLPHCVKRVLHQKMKGGFESRPFTAS